MRCEKTNAFASDISQYLDGICSVLLLVYETCSEFVGPMDVMHGCHTHFVLFD